MRSLEARADDEGPEGLELGLGVLNQGDAHVLGVGEEQILVVAGAVLPALHDFLGARLPRADILGGELGVVAGALDAVPGVRAVGRDGPGAGGDAVNSGDNAAGTFSGKRNTRNKCLR